MKTQPTFLSIATVVFAALQLATPLDAQTINIQPKGDSITNGSGGTAEEGGYRGTLDTLLINAGYTFDFVGTVTTNSANLIDPDHEGHGGWNIGQLDDNVAAWFSAIDDPDIVLLHIGTNDFAGGLSDPTAIDRLDALITKIAGLNPNTHVIVTNLMERDEPKNALIVAEFNPFVQTKVNAQVAAGNLVSYLDMRSLVTYPADFADGVHPNQAGYDKMAAGWFGAIEAVVNPGDGVAPAIVRARGAGAADQVFVNFNKQVDPTTAETTGNYAIDGGVTVLSAELSPSQLYVTLTTTPQSAATTYTVTVNNVEDQVLPTPNTIAANSTAQFTATTPRGYFNNVPESDCYTLVYSLDIPDAANYQKASVPYSIDNHNVTGSYDRVAYYMETQTPGGDLQYAWASMDAFDTDPAHIGVPTLASGVTFQQSVSNLNVVSNVPGVAVGDGQTGNIEFWPTNYQQPNDAGVPGASDSLYDFGDRVNAGNFGSMQVHNTDEAQTIISFSRWGGAAGDACVGIGNRPTSHPDWTFADNAADYTVKTIQVLVRTTGDTTPPTLASAEAGFSGTGVTVRFSEPVRRDTLVVANFSLDNGVTVLDVTAGDDLHTAYLETTTLPAAALTLTVSNLRDTSHNANQIAPASTIAVAAATLPAEVIANIGAAADNYELVYSLDIPVTGNFNAGNPYTVDNSSSGGSFSRVAYYLELQAGATTEYIWTAMDAFTTDRRKIGVPTFASGAIFQQSVTNLDVISNKAGITTGTGITTGNIEFWPNSYSAPNALAVPYASGTNFDWGDTRSTSGNYGSMQVHNSATLQTLFALNRFGADGNPLCVGIGNDPSPTNNGRDWTFADNAGTDYSRRTLHVMVLPADLPAEITANVPEAADYELVYSLNIPTNGNLSAPGAGFTDYSFNDSGRTTPFSRVAYYMELQKTGDPEPTFAWVSMDAFTNDRGMIGVPTVASGAQFQQLVSDLNVVSNSPNVTNGTGIATGNIEFWPTNYNDSNSLPVPGASGSAYDFGDNPAPGSYGSMQVHNYAAGETIFAINRWGSTGNTGNALCLGIGNQPTGQPDWTFANNAPSYDLVRKLHVLVLPGVAPAETDGPAIVTATGSTTLDRLVVTFDREVTDASADPANFSLDGGLTVTGATLLPGNRDTALTTSAQTGGVLYTVSATGVQARSGGSLIIPGSSAQFTAYTPPAGLAKVPGTETGYQLIYQLAIPAAKPRWNFNRITYSVDEAKYGEFLFDRVAYLMELDDDWVYASFDPHTNQIAQIGVPSLNVTSTPFQQIVTNMNVDSNVAGIVTGNTITTGNIEFWGGNYAIANALGIPNASDSTHDFGDTMNSGGGHGSMQIHNHGASQTLLAYGNWGANSGGNSEIGIGNRTTDHPDWTFAVNAGDFTTRNLYVLARPGGVATGTGPVILIHPCDRTVAPGQDVTFAVTMQETGPFTYQWRFNGTPISGATNPWLEIANVQAAQTGSYDVVVTGTGLASTTSNTADLFLGGAPPYDAWAAANITGGAPAGFDEDADLDGLDNGLEWILGGDPMSGDLSDVLPTAQGDATNGLTLTFTREPDSIDQVTLTVEWDTGLDGPFANSIEVEEFNSNDPGSGVTITIVGDQVTVNIPASNDAGGGKLFARLKAVENL